MDTIPLFEGGPTHQLMIRLHLLRSRRSEIVRGAAALSLLAWLPLLALSSVDGYLTGGVPIPFLFDFGVHTRLLFAVPLMIVIEIVVGPRLGGAAARLLELGLVKPDQRGRFAAAIAEALKIRDSQVLEVAVLALAYLGSFLALGVSFSFGVSTWDLLVTPTGPRLTLAGIWNTFAATPLYQFLVYRSLVRLLNWARFLWSVARLDLELVPTHPDRAGGLAFLGAAHRPLGLLAVAVGSVLSGRYCSEILYGGASFEALKMSIASFVVLMLLLCLGPLVVFAPLLVATRRKGLAEYGALSLRYTTDFDRKWLRGGAPAAEPLLGSADIQSLADLGGSYERIERMRPVPFGLKDVTSIAAASAAPMLPVAATVVPIEELVKTILKILG